MTSWRRLAAGTVGLFLIILAFLAGQLRAGADPAVGRSAAQTQIRTAPQPDPSTGEDAPGATSPDAAPPATHQS